MQLNSTSAQQNEAHLSERKKQKSLTPNPMSSQHYDKVPQNCIKAQHNYWNLLHTEPMEQKNEAHALNQGSNKNKSTDNSIISKNCPKVTLNSSEGEQNCLNIFSALKMQQKSTGQMIDIEKFDKCRCFRQEIEQRVYRDICQGRICIKEQSQNVSYQKVRDNVRSFKKQINDFFSYRSISRSDVSELPGKILSNEEHKKLVRMFLAKRSESAQKQNQNKIRIQQKIEFNKKQQQKQMEEIKQKWKQERIQKILEKRQDKIRKRNYQSLDFQRNSRSEMKTHKKDKLLYKKLEEKYIDEFVIPQLKRKQKKLQQIHELKNSLNFKQIREHERSYRTKKNKSFSERKKEDSGWIYRPPPKTDRLMRILKEEQEQNKLLEIQKSKKVSEKLQRLQNYSTYLKINFAPKMKQKSLENSKIDAKQNSKQKNNQNIFRINEKDSISKDHFVQRKQLGLQYLRQMKQKGRKKTRNVFTQRQSPLTIENTQKSDYLTERRKGDEFYLQKRLKNVNKMYASPQDPSPEKVRYLERSAQKLREIYDKKTEIKKITKGTEGKEDTQIDEDIDLLLGQIQAKIGIVAMCQKMDQNI